MDPELDQLANPRGPSVTIVSTAAVAKARAGLERVATCSSNESSPLVTHATPPCAQAVFESAPRAS